MNILKPDVPVGLACDHAGYELKQFVIDLLSQKGIPYKDFGTYSTEELRLSRFCPSFGFCC